MDIEKLVADAAARGTSDIHVVCGVPVKLRINGQLHDADDHILTDEDCEAVGKALPGMTTNPLHIKVNLTWQQPLLATE